MKTDCGDVRQPSLLESGGLSGKHMLSPLNTIIIVMMMMMMMMMMIVTTNNDSEGADNYDNTIAMIKMMMITMMTMVNPPDDKVKLSKVKANIVNSKHLILRAQLVLLLLLFLLLSLFLQHCLN